MLKRLLREEPTLVIGLARAMLVVAVAFGLPLTDEQTAALVGVAAAGLALAGLNRQVVVPVSKLPGPGAIIDTAAEEAREILNELDGKD